MLLQPYWKLWLNLLIVHINFHFILIEIDNYINNSEKDYLVMFPSNSALSNTSHNSI